MDNVRTAYSYVILEKNISINVTIHKNFLIIFLFYSHIYEKSLNKYTQSLAPLS